MTCGGSKGEPGFVCDAHSKEGTLECLRSAHKAGQIHQCPGCTDCRPCECGGTGIELHGHLKHCPCPIGQKMEHAEMNKGIENFDQPAPCVGCKGTRDITRRHKAGGHVLEYETVCPRCNGTGREP